MLRYILNTLTSTLHHAVLDGDDEDVLRFLLILLACVSMLSRQVVSANREFFLFMLCFLSRTDLQLQGMHICAFHSSSNSEGDKGNDVLTLSNWN